jgi:hypothetical protein
MDGKIRWRLKLTTGLRLNFWCTRLSAATTLLAIGRIVFEHQADNRPEVMLSGSRLEQHAT